MRTVVFSSILLLGFINFLVAIFYINQTSSVNSISLITSCFIAFVVYVTGFNPLRSNAKTFAFVFLCNAFIISVMIGVHYVPYTRRLLFTSSKKYVQEQNEYKRLLQ